MRRISALFALALLPASAWAQVRGGAVIKAGLEASAAPAPLMSASALPLSPATMAASPMAASLAVPAPLPAPVAAIAVPAVAAVPAKASLAPTPSASLKEFASLTLKFATPDKSGAAEAAASALFDGALSAPAIGDDPFVPGSAPESRRSSGLSPPTDAELIGAYREAKPKSQAVETFGRDFVTAAGQAIQKYTFMGDYFMKSIRADRPVLRAIEDLIAAHDERESPSSRRFMGLLGRWYAFQDHAQEQMIAMKYAMMRRMGQEPARNLPPSPIPGGDYWDMAAGMNAQGFIHRELDPATRYTFFDYSPFVVSYLKTAAELAGAKNASVVEADLLKLEKPAKPLAVLRTKNAAHYVPGFSKKLETMADWIAPGGQLVIQNDPSPGQRQIIIEQHGPLVRRLIAEGWAFEYGFTRTPGKWGAYGLDTMILTRPKLVFEKTPAEAAAEWRSYEKSVRYLEKDMAPFGFLFGR